MHNISAWLSGNMLPSNPQGLLVLRLEYLVFLSAIFRTLSFVLPLQSRQGVGNLSVCQVTVDAARAFATRWECNPCIAFLCSFALWCASRMIGYCCITQRESELPTPTENTTCLGLALLLKPGGLRQSFWRLCLLERGDPETDLDGFDPWTGSGLSHHLLSTSCLHQIILQRPRILPCRPEV